MEQTSNPQETGRIPENAAEQSRGELHLFDWSPAPQQQYLVVTSGGRYNTTTTTTAAAAAAVSEHSSVHPLVPLLLYSDTHVPQSSPYDRTTGASPSRLSSISSISSSSSSISSSSSSSIISSSSRQAVKKPLNAFMLFMKETRHKVLQEGRERESAAINRVLGRKWNALSSSEQSKYYDLAQKERLLHMQLYPGWSARDNYGKRKRRRNQQLPGEKKLIN